MRDMVRPSSKQRKNIKSNCPREMSNAVNDQFASDIFAIVEFRRLSFNSIYRVLSDLKKKLKTGNLSAVQMHGLVGYLFVVDRPKTKNQNPK